MIFHYYLHGYRLQQEARKQAQAFVSHTNKQQHFQVMPRRHHM